MVTLVRLIETLERIQESEEHARQIALMRWLSRAAQELGVGENSYVVGGAVRNFLIGKPIKDIDIMIDSKALGGKDAAWFARKLAGMIPARTRLVTNKYGVAILTIKGDWEIDGIPMKGETIEIATAREEWYGGAEGKGYKPSKVEPATAEQDVKRREFTVNTLMWKLAHLAKGPDKAEIVDLTGCGLRDLKKGVLRCPSDPDKTFRDDPTRMLRAVKFITKYGFRVDDETGDAIRRNARYLKNAPPEAIAQILIDTILSKNAPLTVKELRKLGLLQVIGQIVASSKPFEVRLRRWAENQDPLLVFRLIDLGLPLKYPFKGLEHRDKEIRRALARLPDRDASRLAEILKKPTTVFRDRSTPKKLAVEFGVAGRAVGDFMQRLQAAIVNALLDDPRLVNREDRLLQKVRASLS